MFSWHLEFSSPLILPCVFLIDYTESIFTTFHLKKKNHFLSYFSRKPNFYPFLQHNFSARLGFSKLPLLWSSLIYKEFEGEFREEFLLTFYWIQCGEKSACTLLSLLRINWVFAQNEIWASNLLILKGRSVFMFT